MKIMKDYRQFIETVAVEAGALLRERLNERHTVQYKGEINLVTEADRLSEALIVERIRRSFPGHDILAEESPETTKGSGFRWIIDPLDGTTNYAHGYPIFCVSIALEVEGEICLGAVYNPMLTELFVAEKGEGAFLNGRRLAVSRTADLSRRLLATGFPYDLRENRNNNFTYYQGAGHECPGGPAGRFGRPRSGLRGGGPFRRFLGTEAHALGYRGRMAPRHRGGRRR